MKNSLLVAVFVAIIIGGFAIHYAATEQVWPFAPSTPVASQPAPGSAHG
ncbi:MAG: hypothetical protein ACREP6_05580 [Candidatus Binataceae bacterium]